MTGPYRSKSFNCNLFVPKIDKSAWKFNEILINQSACNIQKLINLLISLNQYYYFALIFQDPSVIVADDRPRYSYFAGIREPETYNF